MTTPLSNRLDNGRTRKKAIAELIAADEPSGAEALVRWFSSFERAFPSNNLQPQVMAALGSMPKSGSTALMELIRSLGDTVDSDAAAAALVALGDVRAVRLAFEAEVDRFDQRHAQVDAVLGDLDDARRAHVHTMVFGRSGRTTARLDDDDPAFSELGPKLAAATGIRDRNELRGVTLALSVRWSQTHLRLYFRALIDLGAADLELLHGVLGHRCLAVRELADTIAFRVDAIASADALRDAFAEGMRATELSFANACASGLQRLDTDRYRATLREVLPTWPRQYRVRRLPDVIEGDDDLVYAELEAEITGPVGNLACGALGQLDTARAAAILEAAAGGDLLEAVCMALASMDAPEALSGLERLAASSKAGVSRAASAWLARRARRLEGDEDWVWFDVPVEAAPKPAPPSRAPGATLAQTDGHPKAERAKSGRSKCAVCGEKIEKDAVRLGVLRMIVTPRFSKPGTAWLHPRCWAGAPELTALGRELDATLRKNSPDVWTEDRFPLAGLVAPDEWDRFTTWLEEGEDDCSHDADSYRSWFDGRAESDEIDELSEALYEAMQTLAETGPCRCAAGAEIWGPYPAPD